MLKRIDSLLAQSFEDFTLLISDNASTDHTPQICAEYAARDPRVRYVRQPTNIGAPRNWNFVAEDATGEYFKWATGNDLCAPGMLARCVDALDTDPTVALARVGPALSTKSVGKQGITSNDLALLDARPRDRLRQLAFGWD